MSNNKQSSIEWFKKELEDYGTSERLKIDWKTFDELFEQAKAMHKEEIVKAYNQSWHLRDKPYETAEKYYNETFGGKNE